jgi:hypothetical protein
MRSTPTRLPDRVKASTLGKLACRLGSRRNDGAGLAVELGAR